MRQITNYPKYFVTEEGKIFSTFKGSCKELKPYKSRDGYLLIRLFKESKQWKMFSLHYLVAESFIGTKPGESYQIDHIDNNKLNNHVSNLRWITQKQNLLKKYNEDGHKIHFAKPTIQKTIDGIFVKMYPSALDAAKELGFDSSCISKVCNGILNKHKGFKWEYAK